MKKIIAVTLALFLCGCMTEEEAHTLHAAYCKQYDCKDMTYEEWKLLYRKRLLPGQAAQVAHENGVANAALVGAAVGVAAGSAGARK